MDRVPPKKPYTADQFKLKTDLYIKGALGGFDRGEMVDLIQKNLNMLKESGAMEYDDAISFIKERTKELKEFIKENPGETLPPLPGFEDREEFELGGSTDYRAMVTRMYIEAGGQEGTGMDIESFADKYFPQMADGGRIGFDEGTPKDFNRNPKGKNQHTPKTLNQVLAILKDPQYSDYRKSDFYKKGIIGRKTLNKYERENPGLIKYPAYGKRSDPKKTRGEQNLKASQFYKSTQGGAISMDKINNFAHYAPKLLNYLTSTADTGPLKAEVNRAAEGYDKKAIVIAKEQERLINEKPKNYKKLLAVENAKAKKASIEANKQLTKADKNLKGTLGYFTVNPDTGKFTLKGVDRAKTFAGISGEKREYIKMNPSDRVAFGPTQSKVQNVIDFVKSKVKGADVKRASNAPIPNKTKLNNLFKNFKIRIPGGSAGDIKDPLGGPDLIDIKKVLRND